MILHKTTCTALALLLTTISAVAAAIRAPEGLPAQSVERLVVRLGNGDGTVGDSIDLETTEDLGSQRVLLVHDVDGDGKADLVLPGVKTVRILLGAGDNTFAAANPVDVPNTSHVAPLQLDADRRGLAVVQSSPNRLLLYELSEGSFRKLDTFIAVQGTPQEVYPARLNDDQQTDYIIRSRTSVDDYVTVHVSKEGAYKSSTLNLAPQLASIAVVDLNLDQLSDLLVFTKTSTKPQLYLGDQFSAIGTEVDLSFLIGQSAVASGDFDKDGVADFVIGPTSGQELQIIAAREDDYGDAVSVKFIDTDSAGMEQIATVSKFWATDVNGDGISDVVAQTASYGGCCTNYPPYYPPDNPPDNPLGDDPNEASAGGCSLAAELPLFDPTLLSILLIGVWLARRSLCAARPAGRSHTNAVPNP